MKKVLKILGSVLIWIGLTQLVIMLAGGYAHGSLPEALYYIGAVGAWMIWTSICLELTIAKWLRSMWTNAPQEDEVRE